MKRHRVYVGTSVVGGCRDEEFESESKALFSMAQHREIVILVSDFGTEELALASREVQKILFEIPMRGSKRWNRQTSQDC